MGLLELAAKEAPFSLCKLFTHFFFPPLNSREEVIIIHERYFHYVNVWLPCTLKTQMCECICTFLHVYVREGTREWRRRREIDGEHKQQVTHDSSIIAIITEQYGEGHYLPQSKKNGLL